MIVNKTTMATLLLLEDLFDAGDSAGAQKVGSYPTEAGSIPAPATICPSMRHTPCDHLEIEGGGF